MLDTQDPARAMSGGKQNGERNSDQSNDELTATTSSKLYSIVERRFEAINEGEAIGYSLTEGTSSGEHYLSDTDLQSY